MKNETNIRSKNVVITGASSGAGSAAALAFAQQGAKLVLVARNESALIDVADECRGLGAKVLVIPADTGDAKAMIDVANTANNWQGRVDVWINNAGILAAGDFDKTPMAVHEQVIRTNLLGYMNGAHAILPIFKQQQHGIIINNISIGGYMPVPHGAGYTASKFGLRGFSEALKGELAQWPNIYVCDMFPAFLDTPGIQHAGNYTGKVLKPAPPVYDPARLAQAMVAVVRNPRSNTYVGSVSLGLKFMHNLFPEFTTRVTGWVMRRYLNQAAPIALTDGNVFNTVNYGMSTHGGFGLPGRPRAHQKYLAGVLLAGVAVGFAMVSRRK